MSAQRSDSQATALPAETIIHGFLRLPCAIRARGADFWRFL
jgi:hypothetical protein